MSRRGAVAPLALAAAPHASAFESRFEVDAVDALPYADVLPEGWRDAAEAAVRDEARPSLALSRLVAARDACGPARARRCGAARRGWRTMRRRCRPASR